MIERKSVRVTKVAEWETKREQALNYGEVIIARHITKRLFSDLLANFCEKKK